MHLHCLSPGSQPTTLVTTQTIIAVALSENICRKSRRSKAYYHHNLVFWFFNYFLFALVTAIIFRFLKSFFYFYFLLSQSFIFLAYTHKKNERKKLLTQSSLPIRRVFPSSELSTSVQSSVHYDDGRFILTPFYYWHSPILSSSPSFNCLGLKIRQSVHAYYAQHLQSNQV